MAYYSRDICRLLFLVVLCLCEFLNKFSYALQDQGRILTNKPSVITNSNSADVGAVRCYCNLPVCVGTSYMCRSERGGCFSDAAEHSHTKNQDVYRSRHGCIELLTELQQDLDCYNASRNVITNLPLGEGLLRCCFKDMCNHVDNFDIGRITNFTNKGEVIRTEFYGDSATSTAGSAINEDWFKAATIAVPICGALILFMLIALAVKILKTEGGNDHSSKLGSHFISETSVEKRYSGPTNSLNCMPLLLQVCDNENANSNCVNHTMSKTRNSTSTLPLLVQNHTGTKISYENKNETNAKLNFVSNLEYNLLPGSPDNIHKAANNLGNTLYKDISLSNTNSTSNEVESKLYNKTTGWS